MLFKDLIIIVLTVEKAYLTYFFKKLNKQPSMAESQ